MAKVGMTGIWMGRFTRIRWRGPTAYIGLMMAGGMLALFGLPVPFTVLLFAALINGAALEIGALIWTNILQNVVPSERLGRVASIDMLGSYVLLPIGVGVAGWATDQLGPAAVLLIGGGLTMCFGGLALAHPAIRRFD